MLLRSIYIFRVNIEKDVRRETQEPEKFQRAKKEIKILICQRGGIPMRSILFRILLTVYAFWLTLISLTAFLVFIGLDSL